MFSTFYKSLMKAAYNHSHPYRACHYLSRWATNFACRQPRRQDPVSWMLLWLQASATSSPHPSNSRVSCTCRFRLQRWYQFWTDVCLWLEPTILPRCLEKMKESVFVDGSLKVSTGQPVGRSLLRVPNQNQLLTHPPPPRTTTTSLFCSCSNLQKKNENVIALLPKVHVQHAQLRICNLH